MNRFSVAAAGLLLGSPACASLATFDDLVEGKYGKTLIDGGITFSNAIAWDGSQLPFCADDASLVFPIFPGIEGHYSPPNVLTFNIFGEGPSTWASTETRKVQMTRGGLDTAARLDVIYADDFGQAGTVLRLDALLDGEVVGTDSFTIPGADPPTFSGHTLAVEGGPFDTLRLWVSHGPGGFASLDNVEIVPAPAAWSVGLVGVGVFLPRRRR